MCEGRSIYSLVPPLASTGRLRGGGGSSFLDVGARHILPKAK